MRKIVVISGAWCTGKTNMANRLSKILVWPVFSLDFYKERRFGNGETNDLDLDNESYDELFDDLIETLEKDQSCIVESDFTDEKQIERLFKIKKNLDADIVQVYLFADTKTLTERFVNRLESGERHPGHKDDQYLQKAKDALQSGDYEKNLFSPIDIEGKLIEVNTYNFKEIDYKSIVDQIDFSNQDLE